MKSTNQNKDYPNQEISIKLRGIDDRNAKPKETERNINIKLENGQIKFRIKHENILKVFENQFEMEELKNNYFFKKSENIEVAFNKLKLLLQNKNNIL